MKTPIRSIDGPTMQHYLRKAHVERALATREMFAAAGRAVRSWCRSVSGVCKTPYFDRDGAATHRSWNAGAVRAGE